jgi:hypothetical protein
MKSRTLWRAGIGAFVILLVALFGPSFIHLSYRLSTPRPVILSNRLHYNILAGEESKLGPEAKVESIKERHALFLWFHVRGLNIDEDDEPRSIWHPWKELIDYWNLTSA